MTATPSTTVTGPGWRLCHHGRDPAAEALGVVRHVVQHSPVIANYGQHADALVYCDPPYVQSTRKSTGYRHEMTDDDHREMAAALRSSRAAVVVSGYPSALYDGELFAGWHRREM